MTLASTSFLSAVPLPGALPFQVTPKQGSRKGIFSCAGPGIRCRFIRACPKAQPIRRGGGLPVSSP